MPWDISNMGDPKLKFTGMLARAFLDAELDEFERAEIRAYLDSGAITPEDAHEVIEDFLARTWSMAMADDHITEVERTRIQNIVKELRIPMTRLPLSMRPLLPATEGEK